MLNLVEKFTPEAVEATDEDGVVAIEYVLRRRPDRHRCWIVFSQTNCGTGPAKLERPGPIELKGGGSASAPPLVRPTTRNPQHPRHARISRCRRHTGLRAGCPQWSTVGNRRDPVPQPHHGRPAGRRSRPGPGVIELELLHARRCRAAFARRAARRPRPSRTYVDAIGASHDDHDAPSRCVRRAHHCFRKLSAQCETEDYRCPPSHAEALRDHGTRATGPVREPTQWLQRRCHEAAASRAH